MFSNHFIPNFLQNANNEKILTIGQYLTKMDKILWLTFFWTTLYSVSQKIPHPAVF